MKTHITTLNNMAGTASLAHRRVLKVAQSIGCHEMGLSFYPLKPDYAKEIDKRLDGIIAPLNYGDIVIFQYPSWIGVNYDDSFVNKIKSYRDTKLIIFVQDIQKLMFDSEQAILDMEIRTLNKADLLILPSKKMHRYLKENGLDEKPVIFQTIWDMPSDICFVDHAVTRCFHFAGNYNRFPFLAEYHGKTPIYQYDANKPDRENDDSFCWRGYFEQEKLMHELSKGGFGLVWSDDEYFDRYYSMNQPYKLGTNLAAGIPVIVKRGCVHEKFVERNGLGYAVDTLDEADKLVQSITDAEYMHFHVAAITEMSSKLMSAGQYDNVSLYPNVKMSVLDSLFEKCDFYLDINHEGEIVDAVHRAFLNNMLIVGYEETMHNAYYTADTNTFKESEYADMAEALNLTLAMPHLIDEALAMQKKAAVAADATDYMEILHL